MVINVLGDDGRGDADAGFAVDAVLDGEFRESGLPVGLGNLEVGAAVKLDCLDAITVLVAGSDSGEGSDDEAPLVLAVASWDDD